MHSNTLILSRSIDCVQNYHKACALKIIIAVEINRLRLEFVDYDRSIQFEICVKTVLLDFCSVSKGPFCSTE